MKAFVPAHYRTKHFQCLIFAVKPHGAPLKFLTFADEFLFLAAMFVYNQLIIILNKEAVDNALKILYGIKIMKGSVYGYLQEM